MHHVLKYDSQIIKENIKNLKKILENKNIPLNLNTQFLW